MTDSNLDKPFYIAKLEAILRASALKDFEAAPAPSAESQKFAYGAAETLGYCRLFGVDLPVELDGHLSVKMACSASNSLKKLIEDWLPVIEQLQDKLSAAITQLEVDDICSAPLFLRMNAWAVYVAVEECYAHVMEDSDSTAASRSAIENAMQTVLDSIKKLDESLIAQLDLIALATQTNVLNNWRTWLAPAYAELLPWWLDGRLEENANNSLVLPDDAHGEFVGHLIKSFQVELGSPDHATNPLAEVPPLSVAAKGEQPVGFAKLLYFRSATGDSFYRSIVSIPVARTERDTIRVRVSFRASADLSLEILDELVATLGFDTASIIYDPETRSCSAIFEFPSDDPTLKLPQLDFSVEGQTWHPEEQQIG